jgi:hypothetical protein
VKPGWDGLHADDGIRGFATQYLSFFIIEASHPVFLPVLMRRFNAPF